MKNTISKIGIIIFSTLIFILPAISQVSFGIKAGGSYSALIQKIENKYESGSRCGFSVAGIADIPLHKEKRWSLRPELAFVNQGGSYYSNQNLEGMSLHNKCWYYSLLIPVNIAYTFSFTDVHLSIFGGPAFEWSLFGKMKSRETQPDLHFGMTEEKDLKPCDFGINLGLAVEYNKFFFSVNSLCGVIDRRAVKHEGESSVFQNNVTFSLGYYFRK